MWRARHAFGRAVAQFQAVQFTIADMATELLRRRALSCGGAAAALDAKAPDATRLCAMAKRGPPRIRASTSQTRPCELHGGYGYLADYGIEKIVRGRPAGAPDPRRPPTRSCA